MVYHQLPRRSGIQSKEDGIWQKCATPETLMHCTLKNNRVINKITPKAEIGTPALPLTVKNARMTGV